MIVRKFTKFHWLISYYFFVSEIVMVHTREGGILFYSLHTEQQPRITIQVR